MSSPRPEQNGGPVRRCPGCGAYLEGRSDRRVCSSRCAKRVARGTYQVTAEDRAAIRRAAQLVPIPVPLPTVDQVREITAAHLARGAVVEDLDDDGEGP